MAKWVASYKREYHPIHIEMDPNQLNLFTYVDDMVRDERMPDVPVFKASDYRDICDSLQQIEEMVNAA